MTTNNALPRLTTYALTLGLTAATLLMSTTAVSSSAAASTLPTVGPGTHITSAAGTDAVAHCTVGFTGWLDGAPVAVTAAHCADNGKSVFLDRNTTTPAGFYGAANGAYALIFLNPAVATIGSSPVTASGISSARTGQQICTYGSSSGRTCGQVSSVDANTVVSTACGTVGDSGGPMMVGDRLVAIVEGTPKSAGKTNDPTRCFPTTVGASAPAIVTSLGKSGKFVLAT